MNRIKFIAALLLLFTTAVAISAAGTGTGPGYCQQGASPATNGIINQITPWYCSQANQAISNEWGKWEPIALIAVFFSFTLATIMFIAAQLLNNQKIRNFAIGEYYEAIATAIIVVGFLFLTAVIVGLIPGLFITQNPYVSSLNYINGSINSTQTMLRALFNIVVIDKQIMSTHLVFCAGPKDLAGEIQQYLKGGTAAISEEAGSVISGTAGPIPCQESKDVSDYLEHPLTVFFYIPALSYIGLQSEALALLYGEFYIIMIFMYIAVPVFLIPGIIFRAILPLRGLGGMMIAVAIGMFIIMPTLFTIAYYFTNADLQSQVLQSTSSLINYGQGAGAQLNAITPQSPLPLTLNLMTQGLGAYWLSVLFYPVLIFAMTYAITVQIAQFLGNMTSMSSKLKII
ncbi:MAG: hypothetical protein M1321_00470 [Candidatus Marsarchaeota archaeon]|jgi:hypothetical protein|nr:hypothetical protein [Candidatus Marsarchaeota archaeon]